MHLKKVCKRDDDGNKVFVMLRGERIYEYTHMEPMNKTKTWSDVWNPSINFVRQGTEEGWLKQGRNEDGVLETLMFVTAPGEDNVVYRVNREPLQKDAQGQLVIRPENPGHVPQANQFLCEKVA